MSWLKRLFSNQAPTVTSSSTNLSESQNGLEYFEVPVEVPVFRCSDRQCSCPGTESLIPGDTGYLNISQEVIDMRRDCLTVSQLKQKIDRIQRQTDSIVFFDAGTIWPIFMCKQAAKQRGLNLDIAAADAKHWVTTGLVPLRVTPKSDQRKSTTIIRKNEIRICPDCDTENDADALRCKKCGKRFL